MHFDTWKLGKIPGCTCQANKREKKKEKKERREEGKKNRFLLQSF